MDQSNNINHHMNEGEITMSDFKDEMGRLAPGIKGQGRAISRLAGLSYAGYRKYLSDEDYGSSPKGMKVMYKIVLAAKALYREPIEIVTDT